MKILNLAGSWKLRGEFMDVGPQHVMEVLDKAQGKFWVDTSKSPNVFPSKTGTITAQVPCDVITPLVENGILEEPLLKENTKDCLWVRDLSWWFIKEFTITQEMYNQEIVRLFIEMLDFNADILINGRPVAKHKNTFCAFQEDIKRFIQVGENILVIRLTSGMELHYPKDSVSFYCANNNAICDQRVYCRKPQFTYGWDWCQPVPTCGIGRSIYIEAFSGARVSASRVDTKAIYENGADVEIFFELEKSDMVSSEDAVLQFELLLGDKVVYQANRELLLVGGMNYCSETVFLEHAKLWWPNGYGPQTQYTLRTWCISKGNVIESREKRVGIRTVEIDHSYLEDGTRNFFFKVNGVRIFGKGGNWVPTDSVYLRTPDHSYKVLVDEAKAANFTMLRMWGGGTYEPECFYEYCSENGILLMHDFMYACGFYPDHLDSFLYEAQREADYQTKRLAHYACMAVWTGNNEIHESFTDWFPEPVMPDRFYGEKIFNYIQPEMVRKNSPAISYMPSSPYFGKLANQVDEGDVHAWSYLGRREETKFKFLYELEAFDRMPARFSSEYGFFGAQMESTVRRYMGDAPLSFENPVWKHHGEFQRKRNSIDGAINRHLTEFSTLDEKAYLCYSGIMQGCLYAEMGEAMRRKSFGAGDLIWMYNDCWPETGWTIIDYYLTRKVSFYFLKRAFAAKKLIVRQEENGVEITVINEGPENLELNLTYGYMDFLGNEAGTGTKQVKAAAHSWQQFLLPVSGNTAKGIFFAEAEEAGFETADSLRAYYRNYVFPKAEVQLLSAEPRGEDLLITLRANAYAPVVYLQTSDDRMHYSDNYFKLYPNREKKVYLKNCKEIPGVFVAEMMPGTAEQAENEGIPQAF